MTNYLPHISVMLNECLDAFQSVASNDTHLNFLDLTFGAGGHSVALLNRYPNSSITAFDQDVEAIANGERLITDLKLHDRIKLIHGNFVNFREELNQLGPIKFHGILMDLGVSSHQFDSFERGFSYRGDGILDMRMDITAPIPTAKDLISNLTEKELADIFYLYGEERLARKIARKIVERRSVAPIEMTKDLENIIFHCYPPNSRHQKTHPATRVFQALRIAVNQELDVLSNVLDQLSDFLENNGVLAVISFHSLEDRIVKHKFKELVDNCENQVRILTKKPIIPSQDELDLNPRARSAKLRLLEKMEDNYGGLNGNKKQKEKFF